MADDDVDVIRRGYAAWNARDLEATLEAIDPEIVWTFAPEALFPGMDAVYRGHEGLHRFWETFLEPWPDIRVEIEEIHRRDDLYVVFVRFQGVATGSGIELDAPSAHLWRLREGKAIYFEATNDRDAALRRDPGGDGAADR